MKKNNKDGVWVRDCNDRFLLVVKNGKFSYIEDESTWCRTLSGAITRGKNLSKKLSIEFRGREFSVLSLDKSMKNYAKKMDKFLNSKPIIYNGMGC